MKGALGIGFTETIDNPGGGDCAFYAFALGLINIIQHESKETRPMFNKWQALDSDSDPESEIGGLYDVIYNFNMHRRDDNLLYKLQRSLRKICYKGQVLALEACLKVKEEDSYNALIANPTFVKFLQYYHRNEMNPNFNEFIGNNPIQQAIDGIKKEIDPKRPELALGKLFKSLVLNAKQEIDPASPVLKAMERIKGNRFWGTHFDLNILAGIFEIHLHTLVDGKPIQKYYDIPKRPIIVVSNHRDLHWTTQIQVSESTQSNPRADTKRTDTIPSDTSRLYLSFLNTKVKRAVQAYTEHSNSIWFSLFHHHGATGRTRALEFYQRFSRFTSYEEAARYLVRFLRDDNNGNTHPHSFRTMLLNEFLDYSLNNVSNNYPDALWRFIDDLQQSTDLTIKIR